MSVNPESADTGLGEIEVVANPDGPTDTLWLKRRPRATATSTPEYVPRETPYKAAEHMYDISQYPGAITVQVSCPQHETLGIGLEYGPKFHYVRIKSLSGFAAKQCPQLAVGQTILGMNGEECIGAPPKLLMAAMNACRGQLELVVVPELELQYAELAGAPSIALLNCTIATHVPSTCSFVPLSIEQAKFICTRAGSIRSYIGHKSLVPALSLMLGLEEGRIWSTRDKYDQPIGGHAIAFQINLPERVPEGHVFSQEEIERIVAQGQYTLCMITRFA